MSSFLSRLKVSFQRFPQKIHRTFEIIQQEGVKGIFSRFHRRYLIGHHWNMLIKLNLWTTFYHINPIIVHQMGKVGSKTVQLSLEKAYRNIPFIPPVLHSHVLVNLNSIESGIVDELGDWGRDLGIIRDARQMNRIIFSNPRFRWSVISLVRDPVARNVGAFFQNLSLIMRDWQHYYHSSQFNIKEIQDIFFKTRSIHNTSIYWFDSQLKPVFDMDVFALPFSVEDGYQIYSSAKADMLLLRLEDLESVAAKAMDEFLGLKNFKIYNDNLGEDKEYAQLYADFKRARLPAEYVDGVYQSKMATHFYSPAELQEFRKKWVTEE